MFLFPTDQCLVGSCLQCTRHEGRVRAVIRLTTVPGLGLLMVARLPKLTIICCRHYFCHSLILFKVAGEKYKIFRAEPPSCNCIFCPVIYQTESGYYRAAVMMRRSNVVTLNVVTCNYYSDRHLVTSLSRPRRAGGIPGACH